MNISEIAKAGARAADLVRRILAFSRPDEFVRIPQSVLPVVDEALKLVRATLPAAIRIETQFASDLPPVSVDASQVHQIVVNLATNSAHAIGDKPGVISVRLYPRLVTADDLTAIPGLSEGPYVCLAISDDGCGMDRATLDRIFDPFFTTKPVGQGTGLGLSIVHGIVTSYGGTVTAYSQPGQGTSFVLYFPASETSVAPQLATPVAKAISRPPHTENILYIDDEEGLVMLGTILLERLGYKVSGHTDASAAVAEFRSDPSRFAAVVTDLSMPRMSGFEVTRQLRAIRADVPIILASGFVRAEDEEHASALGIHRILLKPSTVDILAQALDELLTSTHLANKP